MLQPGNRLFVSGRRGANATPPVANGLAARDGRLLPASGLGEHVNQGDRVGVYANARRADRRAAICTRYVGLDRQLLDPGGHRVQLAAAMLQFLAALAQPALPFGDSAAVAGKTLQLFRRYFGRQSGFRQRAAPTATGRGERRPQPLRSCARQIWPHRGPPIAELPAAPTRLALPILAGPRAAGRLHRRRPLWRQASLVPRPSCPICSLVRRSCSRHESICREFDRSSVTLTPTAAPLPHRPSAANVQPGRPPRRIPA